VSDTTEFQLETLFDKAQLGVLTPKIIEIDGGEASQRKPCAAMVVPTCNYSSNGTVSQSAEIRSVKKLLDEYADRPDRRTGTANVTTLVSMIELVNRHKDANSVLFADDGRKSDDEDALPAPSITAVIDYHEAPEPEDEPELPRFCQHRVKYAFPLSDEWRAWNEQSGHSMSQTDFARFMEDHLLDVVSPEAAGETAKLMAQSLGVTYATHAKLLDLSRGLEVSVDHKIGQIVNLQTGEAKVTFTEEHKDVSGAPITIPGAFIVGIPVFRGATDRYQIPARLRYRKSGASLVWWFDLYRADSAFEFAFRDACESIRSGTSLPLYYGTPEV
jgi:hypothetical protein